MKSGGSDGKKGGYHINISHIFVGLESGIKFAFAPSVVISDQLLKQNGLMPQRIETGEPRMRGRQGFLNK